MSLTLLLHRLPFLLTPSLLLPRRRPPPLHLDRPLAPQHTTRACWALQRMASLVQTANPALTKASLAQAGGQTFLAGGATAQQGLRVIRPCAFDLKLLVLNVNGLPDPRADPAAAANKTAALLDIIRHRHIVVLTETRTDDMDRLMIGLSALHKLIGNTSNPHGCAGRRGFGVAVEAAKSCADF